MPYKVWLLLIAGPAFFLLAIFSLSVILGARRVPATEIPERVTALAPHVLLGVLLCLRVLMTGSALAEVKDAWRLPGPGRSVGDTIIGLGVGALLGVSYLYWLAPLLETMQRRYGDFVPPGAVLPTLSRGIGLFFLANVLLAPLVEETLYRGISIPFLTAQFGAFWAVILTCAFFGLLHWAGGFWYMLLTGVVAGGAFAWLFVWRGSVLAPFAAHLALNAIEFLYAWHKDAQP